MLQLLGVVITAFGIAMAVFKPGLDFGEKLTASKKESAKALAEALSFAAQDGATSSFVRKVPVKPGQGHIGYFQIKDATGINYISIFENGDIAMKAAAEKEWTFYKGPGELNKLYGTLRDAYGTNVKPVHASLTVEDVGSVGKELLKAPGAVKVFKP